MGAAAGNLACVSLELGGKSPCIVFADADIATAAERAPYSVFANAGQDCCARTRIFVQRDVLDEFTERFVARTRQIRVGDPLRPETEIGSLVSPAQKQRALDYLRIGEEEGAHVLAGGQPGRGRGVGGRSLLFPAGVGGVRNDVRRAPEENFWPRGL